MFSWAGEERAGHGQLADYVIVFWAREHALCRFMLKSMAGSVMCAGFFNKEERMLTIERLRENHQGVGPRQLKWYQVREACLDLRVSLNC